MAQESLQEQMREDVQRALRKPPEQRHWAMIVDVRKCVGCHACTVACKAENKTPPGVNYRTVKEAEVGTYPNVQRLFMPTLCMQCENPPCVKACKDGSITKGKDGVVRIDYAKTVARGKSARTASAIIVCTAWKPGCCRPVCRPASPRPTTSAI
jgi:tetrathionate reductase subunit B